MTGKRGPLCRLLSRFSGRLLRNYSIKEKRRRLAVTAIYANNEISEKYFCLPTTHFWIFYHNWSDAQVLQINLCFREGLCVH